MQQGQEAIETARLVLRPAGRQDLETMAALHADPRVWTHLPTGRHTSVDQTGAYLADIEEQWERDGLGYWVAELREAVGDLDTGEIAGIGGCAVPPGATWWNLYYRLRPAVHGHGLAGELSRAARAAARSVDPDRPVVAFLLEHNLGSRRTAERAGLELVWRGPDAGNPDPAAVRLVYADRPLSDEQLKALAATT
jgi:RimJ/RimL family protein N-acetyltransferase